jgi:molecular chaperone GrpE
MDTDAPEQNPADRPAAEDPAPSAPGEPTTQETPRPAEDWESRFKYLLADFENFRRRAERERESARQQARGGLLRELLPILDAFRVARESVAGLPASDPVRRGIELLDHEWSKLMKHEGVEPVARTGERFRAEEEEAVGEVPRPDLPDGAIAEIVQQGYRFFGGLLRPAKVIVGRAPSSADGPEPAAGDGTPSPEGS